MRTGDATAAGRRAIELSARLALLCLLGVLALVPRSAHALDLPALDSPVMDRAGLLSAAERDALVRSLLAFQRETGHQVVVHTTPSLEGLDIEQYGIEVAEQWQVGSKRYDNGAILTVAPKERKARIDVGNGLEGVVPDAIANRIIEDRMIPEFKRGDFARGIQVGVAALLAAARAEQLPAAARRQQPPLRLTGLVFWILVVVVMVALTSSQGGSRRHRRNRYGGFGGGFGGGGFGGGGGGFGGGGFSGGGGRFGGGGASGSW